MKQMQRKYYLLPLLAWLWVGLLPVQSQVVIISERFDNVTLKQALATISKKYQVKIAYDSRLVKGIKVNQRIDKRNLQETLAQLLQQHPIRFSIVGGNKVVLFKKVLDQHSNPPETINITGKVKDATTGELLPFANIRVLGTRRGTVTNVDGIFALANMPITPATIEVSYIGYETKNYALKAGQTKYTIKLTPIISQLKEVVVEYQAKMVQPSTNVGQLSINPAKFSSLPNLGENDIFRTLQWLPGINATNETTAGLSVRGSTPDQNLIYFDGFSVYHTDHFLGIFSAFNAHAIKDIQVYKGGFPAKFGGRVSSVIDITGKAGDQYKTKVGVGMNMVSSNLFVEVPLKHNASLLIAGRRSYRDIFASPVSDSLANYASSQPRIRFLFDPKEDREEAPKTNVNFYDLNVKYTIRPTKKDILALSVYNGKDDVYISSEFEGKAKLPPPKKKPKPGGGGPGNPPPGGGDKDFEKREVDVDMLVNDRLEWGNTGVGFRWGRLWSQKFYSNVKLGYSRYYGIYAGESIQDQDEGDGVILREEGSSQQNNDLDDITFRWDNDWTIDHNHTLSFGLMSTYNNIRYKQLVDNEYTFESRHTTGTQYTLYVQDAFRPIKRLQVNAGLRFTYYNLNQTPYVAPRLSFQYDATKKLKFKGAAGKYYQFISQIITSDLRESGFDFWTLPDGENIPILESNHLIAGFTLQTNLFTIDVEGYYKTLNGLVFYDFDARQVRRGEVIGNDERYNPGHGISQGVDILLQKKKGKYTGWLSYSFNDLTYQFRAIDKNQPFTPSASTPHEFKSVNMLSLGRFDFSATFVYGTGRGYRLPKGFARRIQDGELLLEDKNVRQTDLHALARGKTLRLPDYSRLDVAATFNFRFGRRGKGQISASVFNLYGQKNIRSVTFEELEIDPQGKGGKKVSELVRFDVTQLGFTPNLALNIIF
ncbi:TonB-dependent receptor [uncultured Microscilla sp.]|uniref:TonB-dependent receptor domain-containing protein n=1 Tax=uncultured Microscilla sp. TaxID=432653 RepID=UPI00261FDEEE|nr:TonB-dependent receptor [uncultured Microscilla sp.]